MSHVTRTVSRLVEQVTSVIERASALDPAAEAIDAVALPVGPVKDALSVTVPIGEQRTPAPIVIRCESSWSV